MYPLTNLGAPLYKESTDKVGTPFTKTSSMCPLTNLGASLNKESIDNIDNTFY